MDSPPEGLQPATFADSSTVEVGQPVMALGTPLGLENTVTTGIISAVDRPVTASGEEGDGAEATYTSALQTDAAINPGNSGGPLVDAAGQVIGINTAIAGIPNASGQAGSIGLGFAIPASTATMIAEQLQEDGTAEHAFVGVTSTDGNAAADGATYSGAEVVSIEPDSPADESSLRTGDLVISVDDSPVGGAAALTGVVRGLEVGSTHQLEVVRDGTVQSVGEIALGVRPSWAARGTSGGALAQAPCSPRSARSIGRHFASASACSETGSEAATSPPPACSMTTLWSFRCAIRRAIAHCPSPSASIHPTGEAYPPRSCGSEAGDDLVGPSRGVPDTAAEGCSREADVQTGGHRPAGVRRHRRRGAPGPGSRSTKGSGETSMLLGQPASIDDGIHGEGVLGELLARRSGRRDDPPRRARRRRRLAVSRPAPGRRRARSRSGRASRGSRPITSSRW